MSKDAKFLMAVFALFPSIEFLAICLPLQPCPAFGCSHGTLPPESASRLGVGHVSQERCLWHKVGAGPVQPADRDDSPVGLSW